MTSRPMLTAEWPVMLKKELHHGMLLMHAGKRRQQQQPAASASAEVGAAAALEKIPSFKSPFSKLDEQRLSARASGMYGNFACCVPLYFVCLPVLYLRRTDDVSAALTSGQHLRLCFTVLIMRPRNGTCQQGRRGDSNSC